MCSTIVLSLIVYTIAACMGAQKQQVTLFGACEGISNCLYPQSVYIVHESVAIVCLQCLHLYAEAEEEYKRSSRVCTFKPHNECPF